MKRSFFGISFNPKCNPAYEARNRSMSDKLAGGAEITGPSYKEPVNLGVDINDLGPKLNPALKVNSGCVNQTLPSRILYAKGWKP